MHQPRLFSFGSSHRRFPCLCLLGFSLLGCGSSSPDDNTVTKTDAGFPLDSYPVTCNMEPLPLQDPNLMLGKWDVNFLQYPDTSITPSRTRKLTLEIKNIASDAEGVQNEFSGHAGCNSFSGRFITTRSKCFALTQLNLGNQTCGAEMDAFEAAYMAILKQAVSYHVDASALGFADGKYNRVNFTRVLPSTCSDEERLSRVSCSDSPRKAVFWNYTGAEQASQVSDPPASGCRELGVVGSSFARADCQGAAKVKIVNIVATLALVDGSTFTWSTQGTSKAIAPPMLVDGETVWVTYNWQRWQPSSMSPISENGEMQIRQRAAGPLLWLGKQGDATVGGGDALIGEMLGVVATTASHCNYDFEFLCWTKNRTLFDHVLPTTPAQTVHHEKPTQVTTPTGKFDVLWVESKDTEVKSSGFCDGGGICADNAFAASRIAAP